MEKNSENMKIKDIGIVTGLLCGNYGTNLQAIALYNYLSKEYRCHFIIPFNYKRINSISYRIFLLMKRILNPLLILKRIYNMGSFRKGVKIYSTFNQFSIVNVYSKLQQEWIEKFNFLISGSDQIWNPYYFNAFYFKAFLISSFKLSEASTKGKRT